MSERSIPRPDSDGRWHYTYVTYNPDTGEWYGGKHTTDNLQDGYIGSGNWILSHLEPERLVCEIVDFHDSEAAAFAAEALLITQVIITDDALCMNLSCGGYGLTSESAKNAMQRRWAKPGERERQRERAKLQAADPAERQRKRDLSTLVMSDPVNRQKAREAQEHRWAKPGERQRMRDVQLAALTDPDLRERISQGLRRAFADPAVKQKLSEASKRQSNRPEERQRRSEEAKRRYADPETRSRLIAAIRIGQARAKRRKEQTI